MKNNSKNVLIMRRSASWPAEPWREATPVGNGTTGVLLCGGAGIARAVFNRADLWHHGHEEDIPDVSSSLDEMRRLMGERRYFEARDKMCDALKNAGYNPVLKKPFPLSELNLNFDFEEAFRRYRRSLAMDSGTAEVAFRIGKARIVRKAFVSRANDIFAWKIRAE